MMSKKAGIALDKEHKHVRAAGITNSPQNMLRQKLYANAWDRIAFAQEQGCFFEVITLCDMIITDRLEAFAQHLMYDEQEHFKTDALGTAHQNFGWAIKHKGADKNLDKNELKELNKAVQNFTELRNSLSHGYLLVQNATTDWNLEQRQQKLAEAAEAGATTARLVSNWTKKNVKY
jgi:hypothetical protein